MKKSYENMIKESIKKILLEESESSAEEKSPKSKAPKQKKTTSSTPDILTKGAFGSGGRSKSFVAGAKARAEKDPKGLMKDLGITGPPGGSSDLDKVLRILNGAIHSNSVMSQSYAGASLGKDVPKGGNESVRVVGVNLGQIDRKNGVRFLAHTLRAAKNAGFLSLSKSVQFGQGDSFSIIISST